jgi:hypothetical protein
LGHDYRDVIRMCGLEQNLTCTVYYKTVALPQFAVLWTAPLVAKLVVQTAGSR